MRRYYNSIAIVISIFFVLKNKFQLYIFACTVLKNLGFLL